MSDWTECRVFCGGSWALDDGLIHPYIHFRGTQVYKDVSTGFRVVQEPYSFTIRGGAWYGYQGHLRDSSNENSLSNEWDRDLGFRVVER